MSDPETIQLTEVQDKEPTSEPAIVTIHAEPEETKAEEKVEAIRKPEPVKKTAPKADVKIMNASGIDQKKGALQLALSIVLIGLISGFYSTKSTKVISLNDENTNQFLWFALLFGVVQFVSGFTLVQESFYRDSFRFAGETVTAILKVATALGLLALGFAVTLIHQKKLTSDNVTASVSFAIINALYTLWLAYGDFSFDGLLNVSGISGFFAFFQVVLAVVLIGVTAGDFDDNPVSGDETDVFTYVILFAALQLLSGITWWQHLSGKAAFGIDTVLVTFKIAAATGFIALGYVSRWIQTGDKRDATETAYASFVIINAIFTLFFAHYAPSGTKTAEVTEAHKGNAVILFAFSLVLVGLQSGLINQWYGQSEDNDEQENALQNNAHMFGLLFSVIELFTSFSLLEYAHGQWRASFESLTTLLTLSSGLGLLALGFSSADISVQWTSISNLEVVVHSFVIINVIVTLYLARKFQISNKTTTLENEFAKYVSLTQFLLSVLLLGLLGGYLQQNPQNANITVVLSLVFAVIQAGSGVALVQQAFFSGAFPGVTSGSVVSVLNIASVTGLLALGFASKQVDGSLEADRGDFLNTILAIVILNALVTLFITVLAAKNLIFGANAYSLDGKTNQYEAYAQFILGIVLLGLIGGKLNRKGYELTDEGLEKQNTVWYALLFAVVQAGSGFASLRAELQNSAPAILRIASVVGIIALAFAAQDIHVGDQKDNAIGITISAFTIFNALYTLYLSIVKRSASGTAVAANKSVGVIQTILGTLLVGLVAGLQNRSDFDGKASWLLGRTLFYVLLFAVLEAFAGLTMYYESQGKSNLNSEHVNVLNRVTSTVGFLALGFACKSIDFSKSPDLETTIYAFTIINSLISNFIDNKVAASALAEAAPGQNGRTKFVAFWHLSSSIVLFGLIAGYLNNDIDFQNAGDGINFTVQTALLYGLLFAVLQFQSGFFQIGEAFGSSRFSGAVAINTVTTLVGFLALGFVCQSIKELDGNTKDSTPLLRAIFAFIIINTLITFYLTRKQINSRNLN